MNIKQHTVSLTPDSDQRMHLPKLMDWKGTKMVRNHSFLATIKEIVTVCEGVTEATEGSDAIRIGIVGDTHTGKTTMAQAIAHSIHKMSKLPFTIKQFSKNELMEFADTLSKLKSTNHILIFDDVSFLAAIAGKHKIDLIQQSATEIRHLEGGRDVKIIAIFGYHYTKALPPYLRQSDFKFYTSVGSSELKNMEEMLGGKKMKTVLNFQRQFLIARLKGYYKIPIGQKKLLAYKYRDPFIMSLFWNNLSLRPIISPTRDWLDPICSVCAGSEQTSEISLEQFIDEGEEKFTPQLFRTVVKQQLRLQGMNTYSPRYVQCARWIERALEKKIIILTELAGMMDIQITKTALFKKLDGVLK